MTTMTSQPTSSLAFSPATPLIATNQQVRVSHVTRQPNNVHKVCASAHHQCDARVSLSRLALSLSVALSLTSCTTPTLAEISSAHVNVSVPRHHRKLSTLMSAPLARRHPITSILTLPEMYKIENESVSVITEQNASNISSPKVQQLEEHHEASTTNTTDNPSSQISNNTELSSLSNSSISSPSPSPSPSQPHHVSLGEKVASRLRTLGMPDTLIVFTLSALPVLELRAGIPAGFLLGIGILPTFILSVLGNLTPIAPFFFLLRLPLVQKLASRFLSRARTLAQTIGNAKSRALGLMLFVGVPLPGTGAWTGAIVAFILGMPFPTALAALSGGVVMAATIMTALCELGWIGAVIAGSTLGIMGILAIFRALIGNAEGGRGKVQSRQ